MSRRVVPDPEPLWRALADPSRREILDALRLGPATTGALCARFPTSRNTVMGHLDVLVDADLVTVERRGRERLNHINPVPLYQAYQRWVRPLAASAASTLDLLADAAEEQHEEETMELGIDVRAEQRLGVGVERAWATLLDLPSWWPKRWQPGQRLAFDPVVGGRLAVVGEADDEGELWGTVTALRPQAELVVDGPMGLPGPVVGQWRLTLSAAGQETTAVVHHRVLGGVDEETRSCYGDGWSETLANFAAVAEGRS